MWNGSGHGSNVRRISGGRTAPLSEITMTVVEVLVTVTHGVDIGLSGQERHQLILSPDEQFLGIAMVYGGSEPKQLD